MQFTIFSLTYLITLPPTWDRYQFYTFGSYNYDLRTLGNVSLLAIIAKIWCPYFRMSLVVASIVEVSMNKKALWKASR